MNEILENPGPAIGAIEKAIARLEQKYNLTTEAFLDVKDRQTFDENDSVEWNHLIKQYISLWRKEPSVCIVDMCGYSSPGHFPVSFGSDYYPRMGVTKFVEAWGNIPDMLSATEPTEEEVNRWVRNHGGAYA